MIFDLSDTKLLKAGACCMSVLQETARTRGCRWAQHFIGWFKRATGWAGLSLLPSRCKCISVRVSSEREFFQIAMWHHQIHQKIHIHIGEDETHQHLAVAALTVTCCSFIMVIITLWSIVWINSYISVLHCWIIVSLSFIISAMRRNTNR